MWGTGRVYYRCHTNGCTTKSVREDNILETVEYDLRHRRMDDDLREAVEKAMSAVEAHFEADPMPTIAAREIDKLKAREAALADKVLDGVFSDELFEIKQAEINEAVLQWEHRLRVSKQKAKLTSRVKDAIQSLDNFHFTFQIAKDDRKREIINQLYSNRRVAGKNIELEPQKWVKTVHDVATVSQGADLITNSRTEELIALITDLPHLPNAH